jgi:hypothetical protein
MGPLLILDSIRSDARAKMGHLDGFLCQRVSVTKVWQKWRLKDTEVDTTTTPTRLSEVVTVWFPSISTFPDGELLNMGHRGRC